MKVLVFDEWIPWPLESGKKIRTYNLLKQLSKEHEIVFLSFVDLPWEADKVREIEKLCARYIPISDDRIRKWTPRFYLDVLRHLLSDEPYSCIYHLKDEYARGLELAIREERPEVVHCEWSNLAPYLRHAAEIPTVITAHNIESQIWKRLGDSGTNIFKKGIGRNQAGKMEKFERYWFPRADRCIAVSEADREVMHGYGARAVVVDNGVDLEYYGAFEVEPEAGCISFTASFDTFSNQDGVHYFFEKIYPHLAAVSRHLQVLLIGKSPPQSFYDYQGRHPNVTVTGAVDDIRKHAARSQVSMVPLRIGGGTRLKILEAMAMKIPVVSTTIGAEGLKVTHGVDILLADDPAAFAAGVLKLLENERLRDSLTRNAYRLVSDRYDWKNLAQRQHHVWLGARDGAARGVCPDLGSAVTT